MSWVPSTPVRHGLEHEAGGDGGGGGVGGASTVIKGSVTTLMPSALEARTAVPRLKSSVSCTAVAVVEAGTAMFAVMITLPAATSTVTSDLSTPAALANFCFKSNWTLSG